MDGAPYVILSQQTRCIDLSGTELMSVLVEETVGGSQSGWTPLFSPQESWKLTLGNSDNLEVDLISLEPAERCR